MSRVLKFTFVYVKKIPQKTTNEVVSCQKHVIKFLSNILLPNTTIMRAHLLHTTCTQPQFKLVYLVCFSQCAEGRTAHEKNQKRTTTHANVTQTVHNFLPMVLPSLFAQLYSMQKNKKYQREKFQSCEGCPGMNFKWSRLRIDCA